MSLADDWYLRLMAARFGCRERDVAYRVAFEEARKQAEKDDEDDHGTGAARRPPA